MSPGSIIISKARHRSSPGMHKSLPPCNCVYHNGLYEFKDTYAYFTKMSFVTTDTAATEGIIVAAAAVTAVRSERLLPSDMLASEGD